MYTAVVVYLLISAVITLIYMGYDYYKTRKIGFSSLSSNILGMLCCAMVITISSAFHEYIGWFIACIALLISCIIFGGFMDSLGAEKDEEKK